MGDDDKTEQLPYRVPGAAQARPAPSASPALPDDLRRRMQAAVSAERAQAPGRGPAPGRPQAPGQERAPGQDQPQPAVEPEPERKVRPVTPERAARSSPAAGAPAIGNPAAGLPGAGVRQVSARGRLVATSVVAVALVILAAGCLGVAVARYLASSAARETVSPAEQRAERLAATWIGQQVSHDVAVACDPQMCAALTADGFPSGNVRVLGQTATYPLTSAVVVVTQAVRDLFGSSFTSNYAPAVLATFGAADASISVRVIAPEGAAAYQAQLGADLSARRATGSDLAQISGITVSAEAKKQLLAGQPDSRLLLAIASLASKQPVDILDFGNIGPGAGPAVPLRFADVAESDQAVRMASPAYTRALRASLDAVSTEFRPTALVTVILPDGQAALRIEFTAPTPLTLLTPQKSH
jgi:hypothetical protein